MAPNNEYCIHNIDNKINFSFTKYEGKEYSNQYCDQNIQLHFNKLEFE